MKQSRGLKKTKIQIFFKYGVWWNYDRWEKKLTKIMLKQELFTSGIF